MSHTYVCFSNETQIHMKPKSFIAGLHAVDAVVSRSPQRVKTLFILQGRHDQRVQALISAAEQVGIPVQFVPQQRLDSWLPDVNHQGVIAECEPVSCQTEQDLESLLEGLDVPPFLLILDGVQDPHNLGACLRSANAAGVHAVIAPRDRSVGLTATVCKVACGAAEITPFVQVTNLARALRNLRDRGVWLWGMADEAKEGTIYHTDLRGSLGLVLGGEENGLRRLTRDMCDGLLAIPMAPGAVSSLNVSVATGVCLFEAVRQRSS